MPPPTPTNPYPPGTAAHDVWNQAHGVTDAPAPTTAPPPDTTTADLGSLYPTTTTSRDVTQTGTTSTAGTSQEAISGQTTEQRTGTSQITGTERRYVDIPTPEEFLDEFHNGFATHVAQLHASGQVPLLAAQWMLEHESIFLSRYLGTLGQMAQQGQPIFKIAGGFGETPVLAGTREGATSTTHEVGQDVSRTQGQQTSQQTGTTTTTGDTSTQTQQQTAYDLSGAGMATAPGGGAGGGGGGGMTLGGGGIAVTAPPAAGPGGPGGTAPPISPQVLTPSEGGPAPTATPPGGGIPPFQQGTTTDEQRRQQETASRQQTSTQTSDRTATVGTDQTTGRAMTEQVYTRPQLGVVHTLSPLDFLGQSAQAADAMIMYEGLKYASPSRAVRGTPTSSTATVGGGSSA